MNAKKLLSDIIEMDSKIAQLRDDFDACDQAEQVKVLDELFGVELKAVAEDDPVTIALVRAADMLVPLGQKGAAVLAKGLSHPNPDVRSLSGESLLGIAEDDISEIRPAIDFARKAGCPAAEEMPFLLAMLEHEDASKAIAEFLDDKDTAVVAAAIEALADFGDPASVKALEKLKNDKRVVAVEGEDEGEEVKEWTIGELAAEAIEMIEEEEE